MIPVLVWMLPTKQTNCLGFFRGVNNSPAQANPNGHARKQLSFAPAVASRQWQDHRSVLTGDFVLMICVWRALSEPPHRPSRLAGSWAQLQSSRQQANWLRQQVKPGNRQDRKPQMFHSWASKKTTGPIYHSAVRLVVLFLPSHRFVLGIKGGRGREGKDSSVTNRKKVVYDESKDVEEEALLFNPWLLLSCCATSERCVCGALPFSGCGSVVSGWCCDWSWIDSCRRTGKAGPPERGQVDGPHTCRRMERQQPGNTHSWAQFDLLCLSNNEG